MCRHRRAATVLIRLARPNLPHLLAADRVRHTWTSYAESHRQLVLAGHAPGQLADRRIGRLLNRELRHLHPLLVVREHLGSEDDVGVVELRRSIGRRILDGGICVRDPMAKGRRGG